MLDGDIYYVSGTYEQISDAFHYHLKRKVAQTQETLDAQIQRDMKGTPFLVQNQNEANALRQEWLNARHETLQAYDQADPAGSPIANQLVDEQIDKIDPANIEHFMMTKKAERYGYFDDTHKPSGFAISFTQDKNKPYWFMSITQNPIAPPNERIVHVFTYFSKGMSEGTYDAEKLSALNPVKVTNRKFFKPSDAIPFKETLRKALNSEKAYLLLENMLNYNGTMKTDFFDEEKLEKRGYKTESTITTHPPVPKKPEDTVTASTTPANPKPNTNVTEFIKLPRIASKINQHIAPLKYKLSQDRNSLVHEKSKREILIGSKGEMTTDPINTAKTPNPKETIEDIFIAMLRTYSVVFREGGEADFPSEKINLNFQQAKGASDEQKQNFLRLEAKIRKGLVAETERNPEHYPDALLNKITFNGMKLSANPLKRPADNVEAESTEETESASKRPRTGSR